VYPTESCATILRHHETSSIIDAALGSGYFHRAGARDGVCRAVAEAHPWAWAWAWAWAHTDITPGVFGPQGRARPHPCAPGDDRTNRDESATSIEDQTPGGHAPTDDPVDHQGVLTPATHRGECHRGVPCGRNAGDRLGHGRLHGRFVHLHRGSTCGVHHPGPGRHRIAGDHRREGCLPGDPSKRCHQRQLGPVARELRLCRFIASPASGPPAACGEPVVHPLEQNRATPAPSGRQAVHVPLSRFRAPVHGVGIEHLHR
jgi:hypothetical protein